MKLKKIFTILISIVFLLGLMSTIGCRQADKVSYNLSAQADAFNVTRRLTAFNVRTDAVLFQMTGNFSLSIDPDGDLNVIGENEDGTYYKHFIRLANEVTYVVEDLGTNNVNKYRYQINFNPNMIRQVEPEIID